MSANIETLPYRASNKFSKKEYAEKMKQVWSRMGMLQKPPIVTLPAPKIKTPEKVPAPTEIEIPKIAQPNFCDVEKQRVAGILSKATVRRPYRKRVLQQTVDINYLLNGNDKTDEDLIYRKPRSQEITTLVANFFGMPSEEINSHTRVYKYTMARHVCFYLMRRIGGYSFTQIGRAFNRDHTSVISGVDKIERLISQDDEIRFAISSLGRYLVDLINGMSERPDFYWGA